MILFLKAIFVPIFLAFIAAALETASALVKGRSNGGYKYRVWTQKQQTDGTMSVYSIQGLSIQDIRSRDDVVDIEPMVSFNLAEYGSIGFDLIVGAIGIDIVALVDVEGKVRAGGWAILLAHMIMLVGVVLFYNLSLTTGPNNEKKKRAHAIKAIVVGIVAMMFAFFMA